MRQTPREAPVLLEVPQLIAPLREDPQTIFDERHDDQESSHGRDVRLDGLRVTFDEIFDLAGDGLDLAQDVVFVHVAANTTAVGTSADRVRLIGRCRSIRGLRGVDDVTLSHGEQIKRRGWEDGLYIYSLDEVWPSRELLRTDVGNK